MNNTIGVRRTSFASIVVLVHEVATFAVSTSVVLDLLNFLAHNIELGVNARGRLVQLHQEIQRANLELRFVDLIKKLTQGYDESSLRQINLR